MLLDSNTRSLQVVSLIRVCAYTALNQLFDQLHAHLLIYSIFASTIHANSYHYYHKKLLSCYNSCRSLLILLLPAVKADGRPDSTGVDAFGSGNLHPIKLCKRSVKLVMRLIRLSLILTVISSIFSSNFLRPLLWSISGHHHNNPNSYQYS